MDSQKLERFFKNECTPAEEQEVLDWFKNSEASNRQEQELATIWAQAEKEQIIPSSEHEPAAILAKIKASIHQKPPYMEVSGAETISGTEEVEAVKSWPGWYKVAAAILLPLCLIGLFVYQNLKERNASALVVVETPAGHKKIINLEDGSIITLNGGSKIIYRQHFPANQREIILQGEAFFAVAKDKNRPFVVKTGPIATTALGTSFNIVYLPNEPNISVALATGLVKIDKNINDHKSLLTKLSPNQQLIYNKEKAGFKLEQFDTREVLGWRQGILYFNQASLPELVKRLETWYGVTIQLTGKVPAANENWNYTGEYNNQTLADVLTGISYVKDFSYVKKENKIILNFN